MDGTHIPCIVSVHLQALISNWKGYTSQNVLVIVDFDLKFTYLVASWEGSVHDTRVLRDAQVDPSFKSRIHLRVSSTGYLLHYVTTICLV